MVGGIGDGAPLEASPRRIHKEKGRSTGDLDGPRAILRKQRLDREGRVVAAAEAAVAGLRALVVRGLVAVAFRRVALREAHRRNDRREDVAGRVVLEEDAGAVLELAVARRRALEARAAVARARVDRTASDDRDI